MKKAHIRAYRPGDSKAVSTFMTESFVRHLPYEVRSHSPAYYAWKYENNPYADPVVWVAEHSGEIAGLMCVIPRMAFINGGNVLAGEVGDTFIRPDCRGSNLFMRMSGQVYKECAARQLGFIYGLPNAVSFPVYVNIFNYRVLFECKSCVRPLRFGTILQKHLFDAPSADFLGRCTQKIFNSFFRIKHDSRISIEQADRCGSVYDAVWDRLKTDITYGFRKDRTYVQWRFIDNPDEYTLLILRKNAVPYGWVCIKLSSVREVTFAQIVDYLLPCGDIERFRKSIGAVLGFCRDLHADAAEMLIPSHASVYKPARKAGFIPRKKEYRCIARPTGWSLPGDMQNSALWRFTKADTDNV